MLRYYMTPLTREMLIAESKRLVAERSHWRNDGDKAGQGEHREVKPVADTHAPKAAI